MTCWRVLGHQASGERTVKPAGSMGRILLLSGGVDEVGLL
jgi:hypothetical protein